jgi:hypothetical protein
MREERLGYPVMWDEIRFGVAKGQIIKKIKNKIKLSHNTSPSIIKNINHIPKRFLHTISFAGLWT